MKLSLDLIGDPPQVTDVACSDSATDVGSGCRRRPTIVLASSIVLILISCTLTLATIISGKTARDPVVEVMNVNDDLTTVTASFAPRVAAIGEMEYSYAFQLANSGQSDVIIERTSKSCSCLSGDIDRKVIRPGESASVPLRVKTGNIIDKSGSLTVSSQGGHTWLYQLRTRTFQPVMLDGDGISPLSAGLMVPAGRASLIRQMFVYAERDKPIPVLRWLPEAGNKSLACTLTDRGVEQVDDNGVQRRRYDLRITVTAQSTPGLQFQHLVFESVAPGNPEYHFSPSITWNVRSPISMDPPRWVLSRDRSATSMEKQVTLTHTGKVPFWIRKVECSNDALSVSGSIGGGAAVSHRLNVTLNMDRTKLTKSRLETVKFHTEVNSAGGASYSEEVFHVILAK